MKKIILFIILIQGAAHSIAQVAPGKYIIKLAANMKALDADRGQMNTNGGKVQLWDACADYKVNCEPQVWELTSVGLSPRRTTIFTIKLLKTNKYLTVNRVSNGMANGNEVRLQDLFPGSDRRSDNQKWEFYPVGENQYQIVAYYSASFSLDADRGQMNTNGCKLQIWQKCVSPFSNCQPQIFTLFQLTNDIADYFETAIPHNIWKALLNATLSTSIVHINNYTPQKNQFRSQEDSQYYKPNDLIMRIGRMGEIESFTFPVLRANPYSVYFQDINANRYEVDANNRKITLRVLFESNGTEMFANCIKNIICTGDPSFHIDNLVFFLELEPYAHNGRIRYRNAKAKLSANFNQVGFNAIYGPLAAFVNELRGPLMELFSKEISNYFNNEANMINITDRLYQGIVQQGASFGITNANPYFNAFYLDANNNLKFSLRQ